MVGRPAGLIIRPHSLRRVWLAGVLMALALIIDSWVFFEYGRSRAGFDRESLSEEQSKLVAEVGRLGEENVELRAKAAILERASEIDRLAYTEVNRSLRELQDENLELREEAAFYRGIVTPAGVGAGLQVQSFKLTKNTQAPSYTYKLVLTQVMNNETIARGVVDLVVYGIEAGLPKQYTLAELSDAATKPLQFRFKYFQKFQGDVLLPEDFAPARVVLEVTPQGGKKIERAFDWMEVTA